MYLNTDALLKIPISKIYNNCHDHRVVGVQNHKVYVSVVTLKNRLQILNYLRNRLEKEGLVQGVDSLRIAPLQDLVVSDLDDQNARNKISWTSAEHLDLTVWHST